MFILDAINRLIALILSNIININVIIVLFIFNTIIINLVI